MRRPLAKVAYQSFLTVAFGARFQDLLLPSQLDRKSAGDEERKRFGRLGRNISRIVAKNQRMAYLVQTSEFVVGARVDLGVAIIQKIDMAFKKLVLGVRVRVQQLSDAERRAA